MGERSIIEISHDCSGAIDREGGRFVDLLLRALASGSDRSWADLERFGIHRITQRHQSTPISIKVGAYEYPVDGPPDAKDKD